MGCSSSRGRKTRFADIEDAVAEAAEEAEEAGEAIARTAEASPQTHADGEEAEDAEEPEAPASPKPHLPDLESEDRQTNVPDTALANWERLGGTELELPLANKSILLLDSKWLTDRVNPFGGKAFHPQKKERWAHPKTRLHPRQMLEPEAFKSLSELKTATHASILRIVCVSHCWLHPEHPDPRGINLRVLADALGHLGREGDEDMEPWCGNNWGVLYDFCSLHQAIYQAEFAFEKQSNLEAAFPQTGDSHPTRHKESGAHLPAPLPAGWRLATCEEVKENWVEVQKKLGPSEACTLADNWKVDIDETGKANFWQVDHQTGHATVGRPSFGRPSMTVAEGLESRANTLSSRSIGRTTSASRNVAGGSRAELRKDDAICVKDRQTRAPQRPKRRATEPEEERRIRLQGMTRLEPEETKLFGEALQHIGCFFSHQNTLVFMLTKPHSEYLFDDDPHNHYLERGWCACEASLAMMVKAPSRVMDIGRVLAENEDHSERAFYRSYHEDPDVGGAHGESEGLKRCPKRWQPLKLPDSFKKLLDIGKLSFTSPERDRDIVEQLYRNSFLDRLRRVHSLEYQSLGWDGKDGESAAKALAKVADSGCASHMHTLAIRGNKLGNEGANELAKALEAGKLESLRKLNLRESDIGDAGATALAKALEKAGNIERREGEKGEKVRGLPLRELSLEGNKIKDDGAAAIADLIKSGCVPALRRLDFEGNGIGDRGAQALGSALPYAPELRELWLHGNKFQSVGRDVIRSSWAPRDPSDLWL